MKQSLMRQPLVLPISIWISSAILAAVAISQGNARARLMPITSPVRHAGVFHVATGRWARGATLESMVGPQTIYNNTCAHVYFSGVRSVELWQHRSRIPSTTGPTTDSVFYGTSDSNHRYDERPGCHSEYTVNGFQVGYCSSHAGTVDWQYQFASSYTECAATRMIPQYTITITGLPGGTPTGGQNCWTVDLDISGMPGGGIVLSADGNGVYDGPSTVDQFGWSFHPTATLLTDFTGPMITGDFTWTGGGPFGTHTPCTGTDGTIWDSQVASNELGTGMASNDFFRIDGPPMGGPSSSGCYWFGGNPHADFYLKLYSAVDCNDPVVKFCAPGVGGIVTCPCGNPQVPSGATKGCDNFAGGGTGGAVLAGSGVASVSADSLAFSMSGGVGSSVTILFQGTTGSVNTRDGAGVRCVGGTLKRLYKGNEVSGSIDFPNNAVPVHTQSASKGYTITPPITLDYYCAYRNSAANGQPGCPGLMFGFNSTNAGSVSWTP